MIGYRYDQAFHTYTHRQSIASAQVIVKFLKDQIRIQSVLDVGCSTGAWLQTWRDSGIQDYLGLDGDFIDPKTLLIDKDHFRALDLSRPFQLGRTFDIVQCLEVAEHLPKERAMSLVADLTSHGSIILFSAAPPGQGGENHINEQPYAYWRDLFAERGFALIDGIRPHVHPLITVAPWYRYNTFLFIRKENASQIPTALQSFAIKPNATIPDISPWTYQLRKGFVQCLPYILRQAIAKRKARS